MGPADQRPAHGSDVPVIVERPWADRFIAAWLGGAGATLLVHGSPGTGKTVTLTGLSGRPEILATHFCRARDDRRTNPLRMVEELSAAIAAASPAFRAALLSDPFGAAQLTVGNLSVSAGQVAAGASVVGVSVTMSGVSAREAFDRFVRRPWEQVAPAERPGPNVIVVDALDESRSWPGNESIADLMATVVATPIDGLRFVLSCRPLPELMARYRAADRLDLDAHRAETDDDLRRLVAASNHPDVDTDAVVRAANGNLLVAYHLLTTSVSTAGRLDLHDVYAEFVDRELRLPDPTRWRRELRPVLGWMGVVRGAGISAPDLATLTGLGRREVRDALNDCGSFLRQDDAGRWSIFHESFRDYLAADEEIDSGPAQDLDLAERMCARYTDWWACDMPYAVASVAAHLLAAAGGDGPTRTRALRLLGDLVVDARWIVRYATSGPGGDPLSSTVRATAALDDPAVARATKVAVVLSRQAVQIRGSTDPVAVAQQVALGALSAGEDVLHASARALAADLGGAHVDGVWIRGPRLAGLHTVIPAHIAADRDWSAVVERLEISPDRARALSVGEDRRACLWDLVDGAALATFDGAVDAAAAWETGQVYVVDDAGGLVAHDLASGRRRPVPVPLVVRSVLVSGDGQRLVVDSGAEARVIDPAGRTLASLPSADAAVVATPDARTVVTVGADRLCAVGPDGPVETGIPVGWRGGYGSSVQISADGDVVAWSRLDGGPRVEVYRVPTLTRLHSIAGRSIVRVCVSPDGGRLALFEEEARLRIVDVATGAEPVDRPIPAGMVHSSRFLPSGDVLTASSTGDLYVLPTGGSGQPLVLPVASGVTAMAVTDDGRACVTGGPDGNVQVWNLADAVAADGAITSFARVPDAPRVWTADVEGRLRLVDTTDGTVLAEHRMESSTRVHGCAAGTLLLSVGTETGEDVVLIDVDGWTVRSRWPTTDVDSAVDTVGGWLVLAGGGLSTDLRDAAGNRWPAGRAASLLFDVRPVGRHAVLAGSADGTTLYDAATGQAIHHYPVVSQIINAFDSQAGAVSADGRTAVLSYRELFVLDLVTGDVRACPLDVPAGAPLLLDRTGRHAVVVRPTSVDLVDTVDMRTVASDPRPPGLVTLAMSDSAAPDHVLMATTAGELRVWPIDRSAEPRSAWLDSSFRAVSIDRNGTVVGLDDSGRLLGLRLRDAATVAAASGGLTHPTP